MIHPPLLAPRFRRARVAYALAIVTPTLMLALALAARPIAMIFPGVPFLFSIMVVAWFGSLPPALVTTALSALYLDYFYLEPLSSLALSAPSVVGVSVFFGFGVLTAVMVDGYRRHAAEREHLLAMEQAARKEADTANRHKDEFLAMLGHELRNPLSSISSAVSVLDRIGKQEPTAQRARDIVRRQANHLGRLVDDLLDVGRVMAGKIVLERQPLDLAALTRTHIEQMTAVGEGHQHMLAVDARSVWIRADVVRMEQVIGNLVSNALRYTPSGGRVTVSVAAENGRAVLKVADTGIGMASDLIGRVFDAFVQGTQAPPGGRGGGLGIGLTLVRRLVELHGGSVEAFSDGPGRGSRFTVRLPAIAAPTGVAAAPAAYPPLRARRVLLVEDNDDARETLRQLLQLDGHEVWETADGPTAIDLAGRLAIDVALVDIGLPGIDGYEVGRRLRAMKDARALQLIAMTGYGRPEDRLRAAEAGFEAILIKPLAARRLAELLGRTARPE